MHVFGVCLLSSGLDPCRLWVQFFIGADRAVASHAVGRVQRPISSFSTSDLRDAHEQIVRFTTGRELIWTPIARFPGFPVYRLNIQAHSVCLACLFFVRFGTKDDERRGYLTLSHHHDGEYRTEVFDNEVVNGHLVVTETTVQVPGI